MPGVILFFGDETTNQYPPTPSPPLRGLFFIANVKIWTKIRVWKGEQTKGNVHEKIVNVLCVGVRCIIWGVC